jgi:hypothetical protein
MPIRRPRALIGVLLIAAACPTACGRFSPLTNLSGTVSTYDFGDVLVGDHASTTGQPDWRNVGNVAVRVDGLSLTGDPEIAQVAPAFPVPVAPNNLTWAIFFSFDPDTARQYTAHAVPFGIKNNNKPLLATPVDVKGTGVFQVSVGDLSVGGGSVHPGAALDFGSVIAATSAYRTLTIANASSAPIDVTPVLAQANSPFTVSMSNGGAAIASASVPAAGGVTLVIAFTPPAAQKYLDALTFRTTGRDETGITVAGTGVQ